jgi:hypothetical protein
MDKKEFAPVKCYIFIMYHDINIKFNRKYKAVTENA